MPRKPIVCPNCGHHITPRPKRKAKMNRTELKAWIISQTVKERISPLTRSDCWIWQGPKQHQGYGFIGYRGLQGKNKAKTSMVHRVMWELEYNQEIPKGMVIAHRHDCHKSCCNPEHLRMTSQSENVREAMRMGSHPQSPGKNRK